MAVAIEAPAARPLRAPLAFTDHCVCLDLQYVGGLDQSRGLHHAGDGTDGPEDLPVSTGNVVEVPEVGDEDAGTD
jgi:hypothetical protein